MSERGVRTGYGLLDEVPAVPADTYVEWRYIGGRERVTGMGHHGRSYTTGEPTFIIRYKDTQRCAYASDLFIARLCSCGDAHDDHFYSHTQATMQCQQCGAWCDWS